MGIDERDVRTIFAGTSQNLLGLAAAAVATLSAQVLITRRLGAPAFGVVTVVTQAMFVLSFATRAGMDMAVLREVAIGQGGGRVGALRATVRRAVILAASLSAVAACALLLAGPAVRSLFSIDDEAGRGVIELAALGLPGIALANVWLAATRGLKLMRYTLYIFWIGQPALWIVLMLLGWAADPSARTTVLAYSLSWWVAAGAAALAWRRESGEWTTGGSPDTGRILRYAAPRAPAALLAQLLFWTDLFILTRYVGEAEIGIYSAALRAGQLLVLFLTSVNLMFGPYVADLHARGRIDELDGLFKALTRWTIAVTLPGFLLLAVAPASVLRIFGDAFAAGHVALLILLGGQLLNLATGGVGFVLIMAGRTGWDLVVYLGAFAAAIGLAFMLIPRYGIEGAAIANAVTFAVSNLVRLGLVRRTVGIWPWDRTYLRLAGPVAVAAFVMTGVHLVVPGGWVADLAATGTAGALAYGIVFARVGITPQERALLKGVFSSSPPEMMR